MSKLVVNTIEAQTYKYDSDTTGMTIDTSGAMLKPKVPAFRVAMTTTPSDTTDMNPVIFDTVKFDNTSNYSTTTGKFTAPVSGFYQFSHSILLQNVASSDDNIHVYYMFNDDTSNTNGNNWLFNRTDGSAANGTQGYGGYLNTVGGALMELDKNDTVHVRVSASGAITVHGNSSASWTNWSGYLVG